MSEALGARPEITRDFIGFGANPPHPNWPGDARIAVNFNINFEGGGESSPLAGDEFSEAVLNDIGMPAYRYTRNPLVESVFEYGSRVGIWRLLKLFDRFEIPVSLLTVVGAAKANPMVVDAFMKSGHEITSHGWRWLDYSTISAEREAEHIDLALEALKSLTGQEKIGWMTGRPSIDTRRLLARTGAILYDRDELNDELPYFVETEYGSQLVIPYSYETNDNRFNENSGFSTGDQFFEYHRDAFDYLYEEGKTAPKLLSIGLHDRLIGRPARVGGLIKILEYMRTFDKVWFCRGSDIAGHWLRQNQHSE